MAAAHSLSEAIGVLQHKLNPQTMAHIQTVFGFHFKDTQADYTLDARDGSGQGWLAGTPESHHLEAAIRVTLTSDDFARLVFGDLSPMAGMATGRMWLKGDFKQALKLDRLLKA